MSKYYFFIILAIGILTLALQRPFLLADPDVNLSGSRGANTDEGLNTCQIRNFINHKDLTFKKSDNFIKTPLFSAVLFIPFKIFGTDLLVGRLSVLLLSLGICLIIYKHNNYYKLLGLFSFIIVFCEYYIFHFFHFCLAEILSTVLIFLAIFIMVESDKTQSRLKSSFLSATFISFAYFVKIQFIYSIIILPFSIILFLLLWPPNKKLWLKQFIYTSSFLAIYLALYFLIWYLPNKEFFDYVMADQTANRFVEFSGLRFHINYILEHNFYTDYLRFFTVSFYVLFLIGLVYSFAVKSARFTFLFIGLSCWFFIELHKLTMLYLPTRYLISLFFSMGSIISLVLVELISFKGKNKMAYLIKAFSVLFIVAFGIKNSMDYSSSIKNRTFAISKINDYLGNFNFEDRPIIGAWAPSLSWKSKAISFPVWKDYFNDKEVIEKYNPAIIIAEKDEEDSNQAFSSRGIEIDSYADSIKYFTIHQWDLKLLWIKKTGQKF